MKKVDVDVGNPFVSNFCWSCSSSHQPVDFFCLKCGSILKPSKVSVFEIFGVPLDYSIDPKRIQRTYLELQSKIHPDRMIKKSAKEKGFSQEWSAFLNEAYEILTHPVKRAEALIEALGVILCLEASSEILLENLELREKLSTLESAEKRDQFKKDQEASFSQTKEEFTTYIQQKEFKKASDCIVKLKYLNKILEECGSCIIGICLVWLSM